MARQLEKVFICGVYGDPAAGRFTKRIYQWFRQVNPNITLGMNTNGGLRSPAWWADLARIMTCPRDYVVFSLDGLEDTNHLYRINVDWHRIMQNVQAFIKTGGNAHWDMLVYAHNEHQVDSCQRLARHMGFKWFRAKVSKRELPTGLQWPMTWQRPRPKFGTIDCHALRENSIYIDALGRQHVCCWLGIDRLNSPVTLADVQSTWRTQNCNPVCADTCAAGHKGSMFSQQWQIDCEL